MSEIVFNLITGVVTHCANAVRTIEEITADLNRAANSVERAIVDARSAQHDYLRAALAHNAHQAVQRLGPCLVRQSAIPFIRQRVMAVQQAHTPTGLRIAQNQLGNKIHHEQHQIARDLAPLVIEASTATGFPATKLEQPGRVLIIGQDSKRALQHELLVVKNQPLALHSETLGFHDDSCHATLAQFQDELRKRGVHLQSEKPNRKQRLRTQHAMRARQ